MKDENNALGERLKYLRKRLKVTQIFVSDALRISFRALQSHEAGKPPNRNNIQKYLDYYGCDRVWLLTGTGEPFPEKEKASIREVDITYGPLGPGVQVRDPLSQAINQIKLLAESENRKGVKKLIITLVDLLIDIDKDHKSIDNPNNTDFLWKRLQYTEKNCTGLRNEIILLRQEIELLRGLLPKRPDTPLNNKTEDCEL